MTILKCFFFFKAKRAPKTSPTTKKGDKKKNPWSDSDASDVDGSDLSDAMDSVEVAPRERAGGKRAAANKAKFKFVSSIILIFMKLFCFNSRMILMTLTNQTLMKNSMITLVLKKETFIAERYLMLLMMMMTPTILSHRHLLRRNQLQ